MIVKGLPLRKWIVVPFLKEQNQRAYFHVTENLSTPGVPELCLEEATSHHKTGNTELGEGSLIRPTKEFFKENTVQNWLAIKENCGSTF